MYLKRVSTLAAIVMLGLFFSGFFLLAKTQSISSTGSAYLTAAKEPTATVSKYGPMYFVNEHETEWWQEFELYFNESLYGEITCVRWETNYNGSWQTLGNGIGYQRAYMDGLIGHSCQVRVVVQFYMAAQTEEVISNELTIGNGDPEQVHQGNTPGEYYGICN